MNVIRIAGMIAGFIGFVMLWRAAGPWAAFGMLVALWGNNMERRD
jgi:hypothetical protein